ncbi:MAG: RNA-binding protein [Phenylobacterium sp.]|nr:RNA-binding protein [Phenylobacterium sp.]
MTTHAEAHRERRDIVSGHPMDEDRLIRFVAGPDGTVVPDLGRKLPGRGIWVAADRAAVEQAVKKNAFSRSAKTRLAPPADLADQVEALLSRRVLDGLGLARRAGALISGFEKTAAAIRSGRARWLVEATDGAEDGRRKLLALTRKVPQPPEVLGIFTSEQLGLALGLENVIHTAFLAGRVAERWTVDVRRLSGFRPLLPASWREEPVPGDGA